MIYVLRILSSLNKIKSTFCENFSRFKFAQKAKQLPLYLFFYKIVKKQKLTFARKDEYDNHTFNSLFTTTIIQ